MNRTLIWQLAVRYLRGKRSANAVPILSRISMIAIGVSAGAMIVVFSVFNGLESLTKDLYKAFYSDIRITVARGKFFAADSSRLAAISRLSGVQHVSAAIEDNVFAACNDQQKVVLLKGIDNNYMRVNNVGRYIVRGDSAVTVGEPSTDALQGYPSTAIFGEHILNELGADVNSLSYVTLNYPDAGPPGKGNDVISSVNSLRVSPSGIFQVQDEFDSKWVLAPISLAQELFHQQGKLSSIEISADPGAIAGLQNQLRKMFGPDYRVDNRFEQNKALYMVMGAEKWAIYAILVLVLLIASFNLVGALSMLVIEKQKDLAILKAMGARPDTIRTVFFLEAMLWSFIGGSIGILFGVILCVLQKTFGIVKIGASFLVSAFPVELHWQDFILVIITILAVGFLAAWYPAMRATRPADPSLKST